MKHQQYRTLIRRPQAYLSPPVCSDEPTSAARRSADDPVDRHSGFGHTLDGWRTASALMVVVTHIVNLAHPGSTSSIFIKIVNGMGRPAVVLFFVLSGYLVGGAVRRAVAKTWDWQKYLLARGTRLYVVLIPALIIGAVWDVLGMRMFPHAIWYSGAHRAVIESRLHASDFVANMLFLQDASPILPKGHVFGLWGSNTPLWSLCYEFWYYLLFPMALLILGRNLTFGKRAAYALAFLALANLVGLHVLSLSACWLLGAYVADFRMPAWFGTPAMRWGTGIAVLAGAAIIVAIPNNPNAVRSLAVAALFALHLVSLSTGRLASPPIRLGKAFQFGAEASFSLYVTHVPFLIFLWSWVGARATDSAAWRISACVAALLAAIAYALATWAIFERRTGAVRSGLEARLLKLNPVVPASSGTMARDRSAAS